MADVDPPTEDATSAKTVYNLSVIIRIASDKGECNAVKFVAVLKFHHPRIRVRTHSKLSIFPSPSPLPPSLGQETSLHTVSLHLGV